MLLLYFAVTTGFTVSVHYCMNKQVAVELGYSVTKDCGKCGMSIEKSDGCCKNDVHVVKMQTDHNAAKFISPDFSLAILPVSFEEGLASSLFSSLHESYPLAHGPPLSEQDTYLLNCVFRV